MHLVLLPGLDGTGSLFSRLVRFLSPDFETTVVDYPASSPLDYAQTESIARKFLPHDRPFIILGESFSGPIAISIAASAPPGLAGLILCCTFARNPLPVFAAFGPLIGVLPIGVVSKACLSPFLVGRFRSVSLRSEQRAAIGRVSRDTLKARIKAILKVDVSEKLRQIRVPVLYLRASRDHLIPAAASEHIQQVAPRVRVTEVEAPHLLLQSAPSAAATIIGEFSRAMMRDQ